MAEFVALRCEDWLPELEEMQTTELFTPAEVKNVAKMRKSHEYKLQARTKNLEDFVNYIKYETDVNTLIVNRRRTAGMKNDKTRAEQSITKRVYNLFQAALSRFPEDITLWLSFFKFCKQNHYNNSASKMLVRMLQTHSSDPKMWTFAANWELEECNSVENARQYLLKGLRQLPESKHLYKKSFQLELDVIEMKIEELEDSEDKEIDKTSKQIIEGKLAKLFFNSAVSQINDVNFVIELLNIAQQYPLLVNIQTMIVRYLTNNYKDKEECWDKLARCEKQGLVTEAGEESMETEASEDKKTQVKNKLQRSVDVYKTGCLNIPTDKMWSLYLDFLIQVCDESGPAVGFRNKLLLAGLQDGYRCGLMSAKHYIVLYRTLVNSDKMDKCTEVLDNGTIKHPTSVDLWLCKLSHYTQHCTSNVDDVFKDFLTKTKDVPAAETTQVWKMITDFYQAKEDKEQTVSIFELAMKQSADVRQMMKPAYLQHVATTDGVAAGRELFLTSELQTPPCLKLIQLMIELELKQEHVEIERVRKCYQLSALHFGTTVLDVWLGFIQFELDMGDPLRSNLIYQQAVRELQTQLVEEFTTKYNQLKIGVS